MMQSEDRYAFDFGTGEPALDYVKIMSDTLYEPERGYGFLSASGLTGIRREGRRDWALTLSSRLKPPFGWTCRRTDYIRFV